MAQLWGGRFTKETDQLVYNFNASISFDKRFYEQDIRGSIAHVTMLAKQGILTEDEKKPVSYTHLHFANPDLTADDAAVLNPPVGKMAVSTDGFIVSPAFFPGGNIEMCIRDRSRSDVIRRQIQRSIC